MLVVAIIVRIEHEMGLWVFGTRGVGCPEPRQCACVCDRERRERQNWTKGRNETDVMSRTKNRTEGTGQSKAKEERDDERATARPQLQCAFRSCVIVSFLWISEGDQSETKGVARGGKDRLSRLFPMSPFP